MNTYKWTKKLGWMFAMTLAFAPTMAFANKTPTCKQACKTRAQISQARCKTAINEAVSRCEMWSKRLKAACQFKKVADRNKVCTKQYTDTAGVCSTYHDKGIKHCESNHKSCQGNVESFCQSKCTSPWKGKQKECIKDCTSYRKARCGQNQVACKAVVSASKAGCLFEASHRRSACFRNVSDVARCKDTQRSVATRCKHQALVQYQACQAASKAMIKMCPAACYYSFQ